MDFPMDLPIEWEQPTPPPPLQLHGGLPLQPVALRSQTPQGLTRAAAGGNHRVLKRWKSSRRCRTLWNMYVCMDVYIHMYVYIYIYVWPKYFGFSCCYAILIEVLDQTWLNQIEACILVKMISHFWGWRMKITIFIGPSSCIKHGSARLGNLLAKWTLKSEHHLLKWVLFLAYQSLTSTANSLAIFTGLNMFHMCCVEPPFLSYQVGSCPPSMSLCRGCRSMIFGKPKHEQRSPWWPPVPTCSTVSCALCSCRVSVCSDALEMQEVLGTSSKVKRFCHCFQHSCCNENTHWVPNMHCDFPAPSRFDTHQKTVPV